MGTLYSAPCTSEDPILRVLEPVGDSGLGFVVRRGENHTDGLQPLCDAIMKLYEEHVDLGKRCKANECLPLSLLNGQYSVDHILDLNQFRNRNRTGKHRCCVAYVVSAPPRWWVMVVHHAMATDAMSDPLLFKALFNHTEASQEFWIPPPRQPEIFRDLGPIPPPRSADDDRHKQVSKKKKGAPKRNIFPVQRPEWAIN